MSPPEPAQLLAALDATWPALSVTDLDGWRVRTGAGGGKRVSATSALCTDGDIELAEHAQRALGQSPLFRLSPADITLDAALAGRGYQLRDPSVIYAARTADLAQKPPPVRLFEIWPPLAIMRDIWADGGIGPARLAVMDRAPSPRSGFVARLDDRVAGVAFCALHDQIAMIHAIEVAPFARRKRVATTILRGVADWAQAQGADWLTLAVTEANTPARALYAGLGMQIAGRYHYREEHHA